MTKKQKVVVTTHVSRRSLIGFDDNTRLITVKRVVKPCCHVTVVLPVKRYLRLSEVDDGNLHKRYSIARTAKVYVYLPCEDVLSDR